MTRAFLAPQSTPDPFMPVAGIGVKIGLTVLADIAIPAWPDLTTQTIAAGVQCTSAYAGGNYVDTTLDNYLVLLVEGKAAPVLLKEKDRATADTILGGSPVWGAPWMLMGADVLPIPQT